MRVKALSAIGLVLLLAGCEEEKGREERREIHTTHAPEIREMVRGDLQRGLQGVREAASRMAPGFEVEDPEERERGARYFLNRVREPPRAVTGLMLTPVSFVAAVGTDGRVICSNRDSQEEDLLRDFDLATTAPVVRRALNGEAGYELSRLPSVNDEGPPSVTIIFAAPARRHGRVVGAVAAGLPLWRIARQLTRQLQVDYNGYRSRGGLLWVLLYEGDDLHSHVDFPPDLRSIVPGPDARNPSLERSPGGYTGEVQQFGRWYGYGVIPLTNIGEGVGAVIYRSDP